MLKKIIFALIIIVSLPLAVIQSTVLYGKEKANTIITLSDLRKLEYSGYAAPVVKYTKIDNDSAILAGGNCGLMMSGANLGIGYYRHMGYIKRAIDGDEKKIRMGYGGGILGYHFFRKNVFNFSISSLLGAGAATYHPKAKKTEKDYFFAAEPELNIYMNIINFCRLGVGGGYRYINGIERTEFTDKDYTGYSIHVMFQFGNF